MQKIIVGRKKSDIQKLGDRGTILLGKQYIRMGHTVTLSGEIYLDVSGAHVVFICGKRGGGKSYTMGAIAEGMHLLDDDVKENLSFILLDTMGVYWTMKYPNHADEELLRKWGLEGKGINVNIYTPFGWYKKFKERGLPTDFPFSIKPSELTSEDWCMTFGIEKNSRMGILIDEVIQDFQDQNYNFSIDEFIEATQKIDDADDETKAAVKNLLRSTKQWGVFDKEGTPLKEIARPGQISVLDLSCYAFMPNGWAVKALVVGIVSQKLFIERMKERKNEEFDSVDSAEHYFTSEASGKTKQEFPLVWLVIDEAHEFLPKDRQDANPATTPLMTIMREGRQPGISLILATQQPGKIHTDVMTQSDTVLSHRITARLDVEALGMLTQSYMKEGLTGAVDHLPRENGAAVLFDDANERIYPMRVRPRFTWHGGSSPVAVKAKKEFKFLEK